MNGARYDRVAIALHWAMALLIAINLGLGFWMHEAIDVARTQASAARVYQWHKSIGLLILMLAVFRLAWRLSCPPVAVLAPRWQRRLAACTHGLLYVLMVLLPLSGWLMVSAQWRNDGPLTVPTQWFGLVDVPHLLDLASAPDVLREQVWQMTVSAHEIAVWLMLALLGGHVSAALLHAQEASGLVGSAPVGERPAVGFRMRWRAAGPTRVSAPRLFCWLSLFAGVMAWVATFDRQVADGDGGVVQANWPPVPDAGLPVWELQREQSSIRFSGTLNGETFEGQFDQWDARIGFDARGAASAYVQARIHTGSATTGVPLHDRTLEESEWFDVLRHPDASFEMTALEPLEGPSVRYQLRGQLRIKNQMVPVSSLILSISGAKMQIDGRAQLDRKALNLGLVSDPDGEYVSRYISVDVEVHAQRAAKP